MNRVRLAPVALAHAIVKYALTEPRGSRYGCCGMTGGAVAGTVTLTFDEATLMEEYELGSEEEKAGDEGVECGVVLRLMLPLGEYWVGKEIV